MIPSAQERMHSGASARSLYCNTDDFVDGQMSETAIAMAVNATLCEGLTDAASLGDIARAPG